MFASAGSSPLPRLIASTRATGSVVLELASRSARHVGADGDLLLELVRHSPTPDA
jgi:hypothetical protein